MRLVLQVFDEMALEIVGVLVEQGLHIRARRLHGHGLACLDRGEVEAVQLLIPTVRQGLLETAGGLCVLPGVAQQAAALAPGLCQRGVQHQCLVQGLQRLVGVVQPQEAARERQLDQRGGRPQLHALLQRLRRIGPVRERLVREPERDPGVAVRGIGPRGLAEGVHSLGPAAQAALRHAQVGKHGWAPRHQRERGLVARHGLVEPAGLEQGVAFEERGLGLFDGVGVGAHGAAPYTSTALTCPATASAKAGSLMWCGSLISWCVSLIWNRRSRVSNSTASAAGS